MQDKETSKYKIYEIVYKMPVTYKFLKKAHQGIKVEGNSITVVNEKKLSDMVIDWEDSNKEVTQSLKYITEKDFESIANVILKIKNKARERGWKEI